MLLSLAAVANPVLRLLPLLFLLLIGGDDVSEVKRDSFAEAANVLVTYAPNAKSHLHSLAPLFKRLALAGHNITVVFISDVGPETESSVFGPSPATETTLPSSGIASNHSSSVESINNKWPTAFHIPVKSREEQMTQMSDRIWRWTMHSWMLPVVYFMLGPVVAETQLQHADKFRRLFDSDWDLVLTSSLFCPHGTALALRLHRSRGVPFVAASTAMLFPADAYASAMGHSPITRPFPFTSDPNDSEDGHQPRRFLHRLNNVVEMAGSLIANPIIEWVVGSVAHDLEPAISASSFHYADFFAQSSAIFVDQIDRLVYPMPTAGNIVNYGPACGQARPLPEDYRRIVEDPASKGTIYVAFGTSVRWEGAPPGLLDGLLDGLERVAEKGYRVVFSKKGAWPATRPPPDPAKFLHVQWAPQFDLLAHPRTRAFVSHAGLKSLKEAICSGTPVVTLPVFAEQGHNAQHALAMGIGRVLNKYTFNADRVYTEISKLLDERAGYAKRVASVRGLYLEAGGPMAALDLATDTVERTLRESPAPRAKRRSLLARRGAQLGSAEAWHVDFAAVLLALAIFLSATSIRKEVGASV